MSTSKKAVMSDNISPLGHKIGDPICMFTQHGYTVGTLERVTPTGVHVIRREGDPKLYRFNPNGRYRGGEYSYRHAPWILKPEEQEKRAVWVREQVRASNRKKRYRERLEELRSLNPNEQAAEIRQKIEELLKELPA